MKKQFTKKEIQIALKCIKKTPILTQLYTTLDAIFHLSDWQNPQIFITQLPSIAGGAVNWYNLNKRQFHTNQSKQQMHIFLAILVLSTYPISTK